MNTLYETTTDPQFAHRSARYLAAHGYQPPAIRAALLEQLEAEPSLVDHILARLE